MKNHPNNPSANNVNPVSNSTWVTLGEHFRDNVLPRNTEGTHGLEVLVEEMDED